MNALILSLALAGLVPDELPASMTLDEPRPRQEQDAQRPEEGQVGFIEHVYRYSELEAGLLVTYWDKDLDLENDGGGYVRYGVGLGNPISILFTYRHYDFTNTDLPGGAEDDVLLRAILGGVAFRQPIERDFDLSGQISAGVMRWESSGANLDDDTGLLVSGEAGLTARLTEVLRLRAGAALDWARTEFHQDDHENVLSLTFLVGLEIGGR